MENNLFKYIKSYIEDHHKRRGHSKNTIVSYIQTFTLLIDFLTLKKSTNEFNISEFTPHLVLNFLKWLENDRNNSSSTYNFRLSCLRSFANYLISFDRDSTHYYNYNAILSLSGKKTQLDEPIYLTYPGIQLLLTQPNRMSDKGYRDYLILYILYDSAIRVSELINLKISDVVKYSIGKSEETIMLSFIGKGKVNREAFISNECFQEIKKYVAASDFRLKQLEDSFLFSSPSNRLKPLTRQTIFKIVQKYAKEAKKINDDLIPEKVTPHTLRHSRATHMLESGINLIDIRDQLGHKYLSTTQRYAKIKYDQKKVAILLSNFDCLDIEKPVWNSKNIKLQLKKLQDTIVNPL